MGFHDLKVTLNSERDKHYCISCRYISQIFGPKYKIYFSSSCLKVDNLSL